MFREDAFLGDLEPHLCIGSVAIVTGYDKRVSLLKLEYVKN
jgi:hypothetical protein